MKGDTVEYLQGQVEDEVEVEARQEMECGSWECGARFGLERRGGTTRVGVVVGLRGCLMVVRRQKRGGGDSDDHEGKEGGEVNGEVRRVRTRSGRERKSVEAQRNGSTGV